VQLGAVAGTPQLAIHFDVEKRSHARSLERLGIGRGIDMRRLSIPKLRETVQFLVEDESVAVRARETAIELATLKPARDIYELIAETAVAAVSH
jgi:UDP:flavonoid glycosyltransferase YjiC (YdhE family)